MFPNKVEKCLYIRFICPFTPYSSNDLKLMHVILVYSNMFRTENGVGRMNDLSTVSDITFPTYYGLWAEIISSVIQYLYSTLNPIN